MILATLMSTLAILSDNCGPTSCCTQQVASVAAVIEFSACCCAVVIFPRNCSTNSSAVRCDSGSCCTSPRTFNRFLFQRYICASTLLVLSQMPANCNASPLVRSGSGSCLTHLENRSARSCCDNSLRNICGRSSALLSFSMASFTTPVEPFTRKRPSVVTSILSAISTMTIGTCLLCSYVLRRLLPNPTPNSLPVYLMVDRAKCVRTARMNIQSTCCSNAAVLAWFRSTTPCHTDPQARQAAFCAAGSLCRSHTACKYESSCRRLRLTSSESALRNPWVAVLISPATCSCSCSASRWLKQQNSPHLAAVAEYCGRSLTLENTPRPRKISTIFPLDCFGSESSYPASKNHCTAQVTASASLKPVAVSCALLNTPPCFLTFCRVCIPTNIAPAISSAMLNMPIFSHIA